MTAEMTELKISLKESEIKLRHYNDMYQKELREKENIIAAFQSYLMMHQQPSKVCTLYESFRNKPHCSSYLLMEYHHSH